MVWIWLANTIGFLLMFAMWSKGSFIDIVAKVIWLVLALVNAVMLYRALDALGFFNAVGA